jgi:hypothetical protein
MSEKINFIHIPKNAGFSFAALAKAFPERFQYHFHNVDVDDPLIKNQFIMLQHPVSRFKSAVRYFSVYKPTINSTFLLDNNVNTPNKWVDVLRDPNHECYHSLIKEIKNENHYIGPTILERKYTYSQQILWVRDPKFVLIKDNLDEELKYMLDLLSIEFKLPLTHNTKKTPENDYISDTNSAWLLEHFYKEDYVLYTKYKNMPVQERIKL